MHLDFNTDEMIIVFLLNSICLFQVDIFQFVGAPLVENCIAGFNSSVFAYGQV